MILFSAEALDDLRRLRRFLERKSPSSAQRAAIAIKNGIDRLNGFPRLGAPTADPSVRQLVVHFGDSAHVERYAELQPDERTLVLRIWHGREDRS